MRDFFRSLFSFKGLSFFESALSLFLLLLTGLSFYALAYKVSMSNSSVVPSKGGYLAEGVIGTARFINPALAISDVDRDLSALVYSGLMRPGENGKLIKDLAEKYEISEDGKEYTFVLKKGAKFHDGKEVSAEDVRFTVNLIQDPALKSPRRADWEGVEVEVVDKYTVKFKLPKAYAPFLENSTLGIMPKHIWSGTQADQLQFSLYNERPIGSGPYKLEKVLKDKNGIPTEYHLRAFEDFVLGAPNIKKLVIKSYANAKDRYDAWLSGEINASAGMAAFEIENYLNENSKVVKLAFPRIFAVFLNMNQNQIFTDKNLRLALDLAIDKEALAKEALAGYARPAYGPVPPVFGIFDKNPDKLTVEERMKKIEDLLTKSKWKKDERGFWTKKGERLEFELALANSPEFKKLGAALKRMWAQAGISVKLSFYDIGTLTQKLIRERSYEALLFGEVPGRELDLFAFWHSSQKDDPGLNIAVYTNKNADKALEKLRKENDEEKRRELIKLFVEEVAKDAPAIFLYSPDFVYLLPKDLKGLSVTLVSMPHERFSDIYKWYFNTERVWNFLIK